MTLAPLVELVRAGASERVVKNRFGAWPVHLYDGMDWNGTFGMIRWTTEGTNDAI